MAYKWVLQADLLSTWTGLPWSPAVVILASGDV